jgi:hypothetical protein
MSFLHPYVIVNAETPEHQPHIENGIPCSLCDLSVGGIHHIFGATFEQQAISQILFL